MAGLDTRGLASGFSQGFGLMNQFQQQQNQNERADKRLDMQEQKFGLQIESAQMEREHLQQQRDMEDLKFTLGKIAGGMEIDESEVDLLRKYPKYQKALDPNTDFSVQKAMNVVDPSMPDDLNDPEALTALNQMFGPEINKGGGGQKRIIGAVPAPDGKGLNFELEVIGKDGKSYNAPMTKNRGTEQEGDEWVKSVDVGKAIDQVQGMRMLRLAFQTPEAQENANRVLRLLNGDKEESFRVERHPVLGMIEVNESDGSIKTLSPGAGSPYDRSGRSGSGTQPSNIREAEALVGRGVYKNFGEAYDAVRARAGQDQQGDVKYIDFLQDQISSIDSQLEDANNKLSRVSDEDREALQDRRKDLSQELESASRQVFNRPEQQEPEPDPNPSQQGQDEPVQIESDSEFEQLPSGAIFVGPDGVTRRKP